MTLKADHRRCNPLAPSLSREAWFGALSSGKDSPIPQKTDTPAAICPNRADTLTLPTHRKRTNCGKRTRRTIESRISMPHLAEPRRSVAKRPRPAAPVLVGRPVGNRNVCRFECGVSPLQVLVRAGPAGVHPDLCRSGRRRRLCGCKRKPRLCLVVRVLHLRLREQPFSCTTSPAAWPTAEVLSTCRRSFSTPRPRSRALNTARSRLRGLVASLRRSTPPTMCQCGSTRCSMR